MKKRLIPVIAGIVILISSLPAANAAVFTFQLTPTDMWDLDHSNVYTWRIDWSVPSGEYISSAVLHYSNIANWANEPNTLFSHLLDSPAETGYVTYFWKTDVDLIASSNPLLDTYHLTTTPVDIDYDFGAHGMLDTLNGYVANDGVFGFAFDPHCHYFNDGISLTVETSPSPVPEPGSLVLLGSGLVAFAGWGRRRCKR